MDVSPDMEQAVAARPGTYARFNRGDMTAAVGTAGCADRVDRAEQFHRRGTYRGRDGVKQYLTQPRTAGAEANSGAVYDGWQPDRRIGNARVRPKASNRWQDASLADVYTVRNGRVVEMQAFAGRQEALRWVGAEAERGR